MRAGSTDTVTKTVHAPEAPRGADLSLNVWVGCGYGSAGLALQRPKRGEDAAPPGLRSQRCEGTFGVFRNTQKGNALSSRSHTTAPERPVGGGLRFVHSSLHPGSIPVCTHIREDWSQVLHSEERMAAGSSRREGCPYPGASGTAHLLSAGGAAAETCREVIEHFQLESAVDFLTAATDSEVLSFIASCPAEPSVMMPEGWEKFSMS